MFTFQKVRINTIFLPKSINKEGALSRCKSNGMADKQGTRTSEQLKCYHSMPIGSLIMLFMDASSVLYIEIVKFEFHPIFQDGKKFELRLIFQGD